MRISLWSGVAATLLSSSCGWSATVYADLFDRGTPATPVALNGKSPSVDSNGSTWTASSAFTTNGVSANVAGSNEAYLPLTVSAGNIYALTGTLTPAANAGDSDWLAFGFTGAMGTTGFYPATGVASPPVWLLYREDGGSYSFYGGPDATNNNFYLLNGVAGGTSAVPGSPDTFTITLNTVAGLATTALTISDTQGLISRTGTVDLAANPVTGIGIGAFNSASGSFSALSVMAVPEPASVGLLALAALGLLGRRRNTLKA